MAFREVSVNEIREVLRVWRGYRRRGTARSPRIAAWSKDPLAVGSTRSRRAVAAAIDSRIARYGSSR